MKNPSEKISIRRFNLPLELWNKLSRKAKEEDRSCSAQLRTILTEYFREEENKEKKLDG